MMPHTIGRGAFRHPARAPVLPRVPRLRPHLFAACAAAVLAPHGLAQAQGMPETPGRTAVYDLIRGATTEPAVGARAILNGLPVEELTVERIVEAALSQNLDILAAIEAARGAGTLVVQRDAAFDPVFSASYAYTWSDNFPRSDYIGRPRETETDWDALEEDFERDSDGDGTPDIIQNNETVSETCISVDGEVINAGQDGCFAVTDFSVQEEFASVTTLSTHTHTGSLGLSKVFTFGAEARVQLTSTYRKKPFHQAPAFHTPLSAGDPFGWGGIRPWTSSFSVNAVVPLPYTKDFGQDGAPPAFALRLAEIDERRAQIGVESVRNQALAEVLSLYWDLVRSTEFLHTLLAHRTVLDERFQRLRRLYDFGLITAYDLELVETELSNLERREELAWLAYLDAATRLQTALAQDRRSALIPADAEARLAVPLDIDRVNARERALTRHPDVQAAQEALRASEVTVTFRENQVRPDVDFLVSFSVGQNDAAFGYEHLTDSLANLVEPDTSSLFVGLRYVVPLGNVAARSALSRARIDERQAFDRSRLTRQRVVGQVNQALADLDGAEAVLRRSETELELALFAYERAVEARDRGFGSEFEVLSKFDDVLAARLNRTQARIETRKAQIRLLAAQGVLVDAYRR